MVLRCAALTSESIVDGPGIRYTVWAQGCEHHCQGCHNPQTWSKDDGFSIDTDEIFSNIIKNSLLDGVTFSGGDPFFQAKPFAALARKIHSETSLNIICYTGYTYEFLIKNANESNCFMDLLSECDFIIDGLFILKQRNIDLLFRGSTNQRFINVKESLKNNTVVIMSDDEIGGI